MNCRKKDEFVALQCLPEFYCDIILALNQCKYIKPIYKLRDVELLSQCIWGNEYF